jgi:hypothetical protein
LSYEVELYILAVFFYLYDSSVLLYANEAIFSCSGGGDWRAAFGLSGFELAGRTLCVLNPFTPYRPSFRLSWRFEALELGNADASWSATALTLSPLAPFTITAGIALFVLLPLGMFSTLGRFAVVPALILLYGATVLALLKVRALRNTVAFSRRRFYAFAFECMACPPFAVNMIRRLTIVKRIGEPMPVAGARLLDAENWLQLRAVCISRTESARQRLELDSDQRRILEEQIQKLKLLAKTHDTH